MAFRLGDYVTYGELFTTAHYGVYGFLVLRTKEEEQGGEHTFLRLELTGDPSPDLQGNHVCFEPEDGDSVKYFDPSEHKGLRLHQYGPTGTMTAQGWVRSLPCPPEEYVARARLGEPPPAAWKNRLYLEWFGPNGHMTVDLAGVFVEECIRERSEHDRKDDGDWQVLRNWVPKPAVGERGRVCANVGGLALAETREPDDISNYFTKGLVTGGDKPRHKPDADSVTAGRTGVTGYANRDGQRLVNEAARPDACVKKQKETPLMRLLGGIDNLPRPESLDSEGAERQLKNVLARMARLSVALNVCEHCTPHEAYRILLEDILPGTKAFEGMIGTRWVQHLTTHDHCDQCAKESEEQFESVIWN